LSTAVRVRRLNSSARPVVEGVRVAPRPGTARATGVSGQFSRRSASEKAAQADLPAP